MINIDKSKCQMYLIPYKGSLETQREYGIYVLNGGEITPFSNNSDFEKILNLIKKIYFAVENFYQIIYPENKFEVEFISKTFSKNMIIPKESIFPLTNNEKIKLEEILKNI